MSRYLLGKIVDLFTSNKVDDELTDDATMTLTVTKPDGTTETPSLMHDGLGLYSKAYEPATLGHYVYTFASDSGIDVGEFDVVASDRHLVDADDLKTWLKIPDDDDDATLTWAASAANRAVAAYCGRSFEYVTTPSARTFRPGFGDLAYVDDFHTTTGLLVKTDDNDTGTFSTTWDATDVEAEPLNGRDGPTVTSFYRLRSVGNRYFPTCHRRATLQVTAAWGWQSVPDDVIAAALIKASRLWKRKDSPEGVLGGFAEMGAVRVTNREDPDVVSLLRPYRRIDARALIG